MKQLTVLPPEDKEGQVKGGVDAVSPASAILNYY